MRRFVVIGQRATASPDFSLVDVPGTSGRLDVLLRCLRAALLVSHGLRRDTVVYLVLLGGERAPRTLRFDGAAAKYLRPDERHLATTVQKALATPSAEGTHATFTTVRPGIARVDRGLDAVLDDLGDGARYVLDEGGADVRDAGIDLADPVFFVGDHLGFDPATRAHLAALGAAPIALGPVGMQADDAIVVASNELDRRAAASR
ncbi:MAG: tRNA (pseudouridine(54)-N(1))-methyltransferase TrmY [Polyangiales bacterium]